MSETPYFSIIVPMYNAARYIKICIDSILAQTFQDFEVIIVDDVSTDDSYKICTELYGDNKKVRLLRHEENQGEGPTRNTGIKNAHGKYIGFVDNDDAIIPTALEKVYNFIQSDKDIDVVHFIRYFITFQDDGHPINIKMLKMQSDNKSPGFLTEDIVQRLIKYWATERIMAATWNDFYRRKFVTENDISFPKFLADDQVVHLAALCFAKKYLMVNDPIYIWRIRTESQSHKADIEIGIKSLPIIVENMKKILDRIPVLDNNRFLKEQCTIQTLDALLRDHARPLYNGVNIDPKLDEAVYNTLLPIFGENTTLVKYLFHGFNTMWRQANILAGQNYLLQQRDELIKQQNKILEQMNLLLAQQSQQLKRD